MPAKHQWLVNPQAIEVWAHTAPALCSEPKCYLAAKYQVAFPRQAPVLFCSRHTKLTIRRAIGQKADLGKMLAATTERDGQVLRHGARSHIHWPQGARVDDQMEALGDMMPKRDLGYCGAYVAVRFLARETAEVTCPVCKRKMRRIGRQGNAHRDTRTDQPASAGTWLACFESTGI